MLEDHTLYLVNKSISFGTVNPSKTQPVRERQIPCNFTHIWNLMNKLTNKENGDRLIDGEQDDSQWGEVSR